MAEPLCPFATPDRAPGSCPLCHGGPGACAVEPPGLPTAATPAQHFAMMVLGEVSPPRALCECIGVMTGPDRHRLTVQRGRPEDWRALLAHATTEPRVHHVETTLPRKGGALQRSRVERWQSFQAGEVEVRRLLSREETALVYCTTCGRATRRRYRYSRAEPCTHEEIR